MRYSIGWQLLVAALWIAAPQPLPAQAAQPDVEALVRARLDSLDATSSFYAKHLPSGREVAVRADQVMNTLSTVKVPIMVLAFRDAAAGRLDLDARYTMQPEDFRRGSGLLQTFDASLSPTYRDLVTQMIITSDNSATDIVIEQVGLERVNHMLDELGYRETRLRITTGDIFRAFWATTDSDAAGWTDRQVFDRGLPTGADVPSKSFAFEGDSTQWLGRTTAREMARMLEQLYREELASPEHTQQMIDILNEQFYTDGVPRYISGRGSVGNKTGGWGPVGYNDVALIDYAGGPIVIAVFVNQNRSPFRRLEDTISQVAKDVFDVWQAGRP